MLLKKSSIYFWLIKAIARWEWTWKFIIECTSALKMIDRNSLELTSYSYHSYSKPLYFQQGIVLPSISNIYYHYFYYRFTFLYFTTEREMSIKIVFCSFQQKEFICLVVMVMIMPITITLLYTFFQPTLMSMDKAFLYYHF